MTADTEFYKRHYNGGIALDGAVQDDVAHAALRPGGRYCLVAEKLAARPSSEARVVELGCGNGQILMLLAARHGLRNATGVDVAFKNPQTINRVEFRNYNLNDRWPFEAGSIDHLVAMMVFEHLFDPFHCFEEVRRTLAPGGMAYVNLPLVTNLKNRLRMLAGTLPVTSIPFDRWFEERGWDGNHLHYFSMASIHRLAEACNLRVIDVRGVGRLHGIKSAWPSLLAGEVTFSLMAA